jgi:hypothetical protein
MPTTSRRSFGASTKYPAGDLAGRLAVRPGPVAEELADHRQRGVGDGAGMRQPLDRRPVRDLGTTADRVGHELRLAAPAGGRELDAAAVAREQVRPERLLELVDS